MAGYQHACITLCCCPEQSVIYFRKAAKKQAADAKAQQAKDRAQKQQVKKAQDSRQRRLDAFVEAPYGSSKRAPHAQQETIQKPATAQGMTSAAP
jgi:hypothetical protein